MFQTTPTEAAAGSLHDLGRAERVFLWGFRALVQHHRDGTVGYADIQATFEHFGVEEALPSLDSVLRVFALMSHRPLSLHCTGCANLSESEASLISAAAAAQVGRIEGARTELERWILPSAADWVWTQLYRIGRIFEAADLCLVARQRRREPAGLRVVGGGKVRLH